MQLLVITFQDRYSIFHNDIVDELIMMFIVHKCQFRILELCIVKVWLKLIFCKIERQMPQYITKFVVEAEAIFLQLDITHNVTEGERTFPFYCDVLYSCSGIADTHMIPCLTASLIEVYQYIAAHAIRQFGMGKQRFLRMILLTEGNTLAGGQLAKELFRI